MNVRIVSGSHKLLPLLDAESDFPEMLIQACPEEILNQVQNDIQCSA
jgi:hypothetical protein